MVIKQSKRSFRPRLFQTTKKETAKATLGGDTLGDEEQQHLRGLQERQDSSSSHLSTVDATNHSDSLKTSKIVVVDTKRVQFDDSVHIINIPSATTDDIPRNELWYCSADYGRFHQAKLLLGKGIAKSMPRYAKVLKSTYQACCHFSGSRSQLTAASSGGELLPLSIRDEEAFDYVLEVFFIGLEDICLMEKMQERRSKLYRAVVKCQQQQHKPDPDRLRRTCEAISRPSGLFAQQLGKAYSKI